jgi:hypothetical protein
MSDRVRKSSVYQFTVVGSDAVVRVKPNAWEGFHKVEWLLPDFTGLPEMYLSIGQARALVNALSAVLDVVEGHAACSGQQADGCTICSGDES